MKICTVPVILMLLIYLLISSCTKDRGVLEAIEEPCDSSVSYLTAIKPIIDSKCISCHDGTTYTGGDFNTFEAVKTQADNGRLHELVVVSKSMPIDNSLSKEELKKFRCWLENGAPNN
jgi:hypothetical protein